MTETEAKKLEVKTEWNGKANVCVHCGRVPETFYVTTGHDHTDYNIRWCFCRDNKLKDRIDAVLANPVDLIAEIETLRARVAELESNVKKLRADLLTSYCENEELEKDAERLDFIEETVLAARMRGVSFDYIKYAEDGLVIEKGFRFMKHHFIGEPEKSIRGAIDAAIEQQKEGV